MYKTSVRNKHAQHNDYDLYDDLEKIKSALSDAGMNAKSRAGEMLAERLRALKERTAMAQGNVTDYVTDRPIKTVGIALLAGLIIGFLIHR